MEIERGEMARTRLTDDELKAVLEKLSGWEVRNGKLHRQFKFETFSRAMGWMVSVAIQAEKMNHHPEWCNVYNEVTVDLVTHHLGDAISDADAELAFKMETLAA
jgi:4a-hydroxytetrahydrobiopterin dehydratase